MKKVAELYIECNLLMALFMDILHVFHVYMDMYVKAK